MSPGNKTVLSKDESNDKPRQQQQQQQLASDAAAAGKPGTGNESAVRLRHNTGGKTTQGRESESPEREHFLGRNYKQSLPSDNSFFKKQEKTATGQPLSSKEKNDIDIKKKKKAQLAREETIDGAYSGSLSYYFKMVFKILRYICMIITLLIITYIVAIYCLPYVDIQTSIIEPVPHIPFNFREGPLSPSTASQFKIERLFYKRVKAPESVALDSDGNMYMAIEGGFVLYAHLNKSSPIKRSYYSDGIQSPSSATLGNGRFVDTSMLPTTTMKPPGAAAAGSLDSPSGLPTDDLVKIAELNGIRQIPYEQHGKRRARDSPSGGSWRRECQLDEKIYGQLEPAATASSNEIDTTAGHGGPSAGDQSSAGDATSRAKKFTTNVSFSRCSKPLGLRLSLDENYLYVVDSLNGLYRISLKVPERPHSTQRLVTKLVDFRHPKIQMLPVIQFDAPAGQQPADNVIQTNNNNRFRTYLNVSLTTVDDLDIDFGAGTRGGDIIYLSLASQNWIAMSYLYDLLEGRPSGAVLRYDTGNNQLSILNTTKVSHVRTSGYDFNDVSSRLYTPPDSSSSQQVVYYGIGAPKLDENDVFDDRPLSFPNGVQLTDDKQAILIADSNNKRIIKHFIRGPRKGASDLWAWTPIIPDNIRRGYDKSRETYWVPGCAHDPNEFDLVSWLNSRPMLRKFMLKQTYFFGWLIEQFGTYLYKSNNVRDYGYSMKVGHSLIEDGCKAMMLLQYNNYGDIIRSIHSKEFPNDIRLYSQIDEIIDAENQEHILYLSSPTYGYVTKITLPTDSFDLPKNTETIIR